CFRPALALGTPPKPRPWNSSARTRSSTSRAWAPLLPWSSPNDPRGTVARYGGLDFQTPHVRATLRGRSEPGNQVSRMIAKSRPSERHVFQGVESMNGNVHYRCLRCGHLWSPHLDYSASPHCAPTQKWLKDHPNDDGRTK